MEQSEPHHRWYSRRGYFRKFVVSFIGLVVLVLAVNGALETWIVYQKTTQAVSENQAERARATAKRIEQLLSEIERQISWVTRASSNTIAQRRSDYALLLGQVPAIERLIYLDSLGREQLRLTREQAVVASNLDYSGDARFKDAKGQLIWWSPVYFNGRSPYMAVTLAHSGQSSGSTVAEINLKFLSDIIDRSQISDSAEDAYIVDSRGRVLANSQPTPGLGTDLSELPQVAAMLTHSGPPLTIGRDRSSSEVLSGAALVSGRKWYVFFQQRLTTALQPVYNLIYRTAWLLALGITLAVLAGIFLARRLVTPIRALQYGARQLEASNFGYRIAVKTADEMGELAEQFNRMADQLQESYGKLEQKVTERTRDLARSNSELKALGEIGRAIVSTLDTQAVLATIVRRAVELSHADAGAIYEYDPSRAVFDLAHAYPVDQAYQDAIHAISIKFEETALGVSAKRQEAISIPDFADYPPDSLKDITLAAGFKSVLVVPLLLENEILGALLLQCRAAGEFPANTLGLMRSLADQSALAMNNARLFREVERRGHELSIASEHKSQFFANMSHELRTPLNAVLGFTELLAGGLYGVMPEKASEILDRIQANGRHLLGLINDVLDLSKIEAGQLTLMLEDYSVESIVQSVVASTGSLATTKGIELKTSVAEHLPIGHGDGRRLTQVLLNLVSNAIKFTDAGSVEVSVNLADGEFGIAVEDTGPGIAPEDQSKIFEEFQQVDNSITRKKGGTGLGLSISRRLVELHGGRIDLHSTLGVGSTFCVFVPVRVNEQRESK
jgi:signal transduction histidine kinase